MPGPTNLQPKRVHIIGGMGTGKTFLARRVGALLDAPVYEMDLGIDLERVLEQRTWVIDGIYLWSIAPALEAADVVVWLDLPYRTAVRRVVLRHAIATARRNNRHRGLRKLWHFAWGSRWYWKANAPRTPTGPTDWGALTRAQTIATMDPYRHKVVQLRSRRDVDGWVATLVGT